MTQTRLYSIQTHKNRIGFVSCQNFPILLCANATYGQFYHPKCDAKVLNWEDEAVTEKFKKDIYDCSIYDL